MGLLMCRHRLKKEAEKVEKAEEFEKPTLNSKKEDIKAYLTSKEIKFDESANKTELLALVE